VSTIARTPVVEKKALNLFRPPSTSSKGKMFVYRANLPRTLMLVAALFSAAAATGAFACEFRAADVQAESYPTVQAPRFIGRIVAASSAVPGRSISIAPT
jgi:hypothetical protein